MVRKDSLAAGLFRRLYFSELQPSRGPVALRASAVSKIGPAESSKSNSSLRGKVSLGKVCDSGHCTELADGRILKTHCQRWTAQFACLSRHGCDLSI